MKSLIGGVLFMLTLPHFASAQATPTVNYFDRHQVTLQGSAVFTRKIMDSGITFKPTSAGGALVGYRYNIISWLGVEGEYNFFRNSQKYTTSGGTTSLRTNVHAATGAVVFNIPNPLTKRFKSFASVGGGALLFDPRDTTLVERQFTNVVMIGGGIDFPVSRHIAIRGQAKTFLYKAPNFNTVGLNTNKYVQTMVPSAGVVFSF